MPERLLCVYSGSSDKIPADYLAAARRMGELIAREGLTIVYAAGSTGMMGALAEGAMQARGEVWGVIPEMFNTPQAGSFQPDSPGSRRNHAPAQSPHGRTGRRLCGLAGRIGHV